ncbi:hypothetical protein [Mesorhizobium sp. 131-3-5]|uniref:hypothetical protein n=1 Tax=Mesorhizobium sp. 131-3-5 TaxID=2744520 RepID=UPI0018EBB0B9|nr:hypothetical protein [Mesorhizobium sp. 131-3-5]
MPTADRTCPRFGEWFMNAEQPVTRAMDLYIRIRLISAPAALTNYVILGYFLCRANVLPSDFSCNFSSTG